MKAQRLLMLGVMALVAIALITTNPAKAQVANPFIRIEEEFNNYVTGFNGVSVINTPHILDLKDANGENLHYDLTYQFVGSAAVTLTDLYDFQNLQFRYAPIGLITMSRNGVTWWDSREFASGCGEVNPITNWPQGPRYFSRFEIPYNGIPINDLVNYTSVPLTVTIEDYTFPIYNRDVYVPSNPNAPQVAEMTAWSGKFTARNALTGELCSVLTFDLSWANPETITPTPTPTDTSTPGPTDTPTPTPTALPATFGLGVGECQIRNGLPQANVTVTASHAMVDLINPPSVVLPGLVTGSYWIAPGHWSWYAYPDPGYTLGVGPTIGEFDIADCSQLPTPTPTPTGTPVPVFNLFLPLIIR